MPRSITTLLLAVALLTLGGCGQTGPLYMPDEAPPQTRTGDTGTTAPQTDPDDTGSVDADPLITP